MPELLERKKKISGRSSSDHSRTQGWKLVCLDFYLSINQKCIWLHSLLCTYDNISQQYQNRQPKLVLEWRQNTKSVCVNNQCVEICLPWLISCWFSCKLNSKSSGPDSFWKTGADGASLPSWESPAASAGMGTFPLRSRQRPRGPASSSSSSRSSSSFLKRVLAEGWTEAALLAAFDEGCRLVTLQEAR